MSYDHKNDIPQADIDRADAVDLISFLQSQGETILRSGPNEYKWQRHDSVKISPSKNIWCQHSTSEGGKKKPLGGGTIKFLMTFADELGLDCATFRKAVTYLTGAPDPVRQHRTVPTSEPVKQQFTLPVHAPDNRHAHFYLTVHRHISPDVLRPFLEDGTVYEETINNYQNVVFVATDPDGTPRAAVRRGILTDFRREVAGSDKHYGFNVTGTNNTLCVFEAPIDLLSFLTLFPKARECSHLALGGCSNYKCLQQYLHDHPAITKIFLCLDADQPGQDASDQLEQIIPAAYNVQRLVPALKDWNDVLCDPEPAPRLYTVRKRA